MVFGLFGSKEKQRGQAAAIIAAVHEYYDKAKERFPEKKEIFYLALTWAVYAKKHHPQQYEGDEIAFLLLPGMSDTMLFSFLRPPDSIDALAYFMVHKEGLAVAGEYEPKFNSIMENLRITGAEAAAAIEPNTAYIGKEMELLGSLTADDF